MRIKGTNNRSFGTQAAAMLQDGVSLKEKVLFGLGDFFVGGGQVMLAFFYLKFLTDIVGINPVWAGAVVMLSKAWDAVSDPLMGIISDNTRTKWGRRRPYIFLGGLLLIISIIFLWYPVALGSEIWNTVFASAAYLFYSTVSTIIGIPYTSMSSEISQDYTERNSVSAIKQFISQFGILFNATLPLIILSALKASVGIRESYIYMSVVFAFLFAIPVCVAALFTKERVPIPKEKTKFSVKSFIKPFYVKIFRTLIVIYLLTYLVMDIMSAIFQYYIDYILQRPGESSFVIGTMVITQLCMVPFILSMTKKRSKISIYRLCAPIWLAGCILMSICQKSWPAFSIYLIAFICGIGVAGCIMTPWFMFMDVTDVGELALGYRATGSFGGLMTFMRKISTALGIFLLGTVLGLFGYVKPVDAVLQPQPGSLLISLRLIILIVSVALLGFCVFFSRRYTLTKDLAEKIKKYLEVIRESKEDELPENEKAELAAIQQELI